MQKLAELCIKRPVFASMLILMLVVLGLDAYHKLGVDFFPKVEFPVINVTTVLKGASPEEVETQITKRIEEAVNTISSIDELASTSAEGLSRVSIRFLLEKDPDVAAQEVRDKISSILGQFPKDVDQPVIEKLATDASPVINIVVSSPRTLRETTKIVDDNIKKNIESLAGVGQIRFAGDRQRQIQVWLDAEKTASYNLNVDQIRGALASQNVEIPGGRLDQGAREVSVRTLGRVEKPKDFERIVVANNGGGPVRISDIATVVDGEEEPRSLARLDGRDAVVLEVRKQSGTNSMDVIANIKERIDEIRKSLPRDFDITYTGDQSLFIEEAFKAVQEHLLLGGVLAGVIVLLFMRNWRSTLIAAIAIPTSIISTYTLMNMMGFTLNQITMLALTLMVGIVIDDAIVVLENIFRFMEEFNMGPIEAAIRGTADIGLAVLATTLSLAIIFIPVAMMGGVVGKFMSSFGYTAAFAIMVSLLVSFTLTPMLCSRYLRPAKAVEGHTTKDTWLFKATAIPYAAMLRWSMRHRWVIAIISLVIMYSSGPLFMRIGKDFLPQDDQSEFEILVRMPVGSSLEGTAGMMNELEKEVHQLPGVRNILMLIGNDDRRQVDRGSLLVELVPIEKRTESQKVIMAMARQRLSRFKDLVIGVQPPGLISGGGPNQDMQFYLQGPDLAQLDKYATAVKKRLARMPGVTDLDSTYEGGKPEVRVRINRDKAADLNVSVASIATAMRTLVGGDQQVTTYREGDDRYDVQLRVSKQFRNSQDAMSRLYVPSTTLGNVALASVASLDQNTGPTAIDRYNRQRQIMITSNLVGGQSLSAVLKEASDAVDELKMPPEYKSGPVGRSKELGRAGAAYGLAMLLSLLFMYMILAAQFESFIDPITILLSLPLSIPFALLSLFVMNENFSIIYTSVGILVLFGIVKKNSILQIDHIKSLRAEGATRLDAIMRGCEDRLRPILMTTAALVAGMLPLAFGGGAGSGTRRTVAIVVIGGQTLCLLLTLLVTPVAYSLFDDLAGLHPFRRLGRMLGMRGATAAILIFAIAFTSMPVQAETPSRVGVSATQRKLTLKESIEIALRNNLEIEIERTNNAVSVQAIKGALGSYDPVFRYNPGIETRNTPTTSVLQGAGGKLSEHFLNNNFYYLQKTPWMGSSVNASFENARNSTSNSFSSITPFQTSRLFFSITQPLMRNRLIDRERAEIRIRRKNLQITALDLELRVIAVVGLVEQAYWDLQAARENVTVTADGVKLAEEQLARNKRMIDSGTLAPVELSASVAELERRRDTWYAAVGAVTEVENSFKTLLAAGRDDSMWSEEIVPLDQKRQDASSTTELQSAVKSAVGKRPELRQLTEREQSNGIQKQLNSDQLKPQVNLVASYGSSGLGGTLRQGTDPFTASNIALYDRLNKLSAINGLAPLGAPSFGSLPDTLIGGYGAALANVFTGRYQSVQVGINVDLTLHNRSAEAGLQQTVIAERRLKLERSRAEQIIEAQVRNAMQALQTAAQRTNAAEAGAKAAKEKLESESRLFQTGESTNFLVLTRQNEYLDSAHRALAAKLDYNKALARLDQALGTTFETWQLSLK